MALDTAKVVWSPGEKRRLLDYIRERKAKNSKATAAGFSKDVVSKLDEAQAARATPKIIQQEVAAMMKSARLNEKHTSTDLWRSGPKILDLQHAELRDVYSNEIIAKISGIREARPLGSKKRKPDEEISGKRHTKRNRRESFKASSDSNLSGSEVLDDEADSLTTAPFQQRNRRKSDESVDHQKKNKRGRMGTRIEVSDSDPSSHEDDRLKGTYIKAVSTKQRRKRPREDDLSIIQANPIKKQKTVGTNGGGNQERPHVVSDGASSSGSSSEFEAASNEFQSQPGDRPILRLKIKPLAAPQLSLGAEDTRNLEKESIEAPAVSSGTLQAGNTQTSSITRLSPKEGVENRSISTHAADVEPPHGSDRTQHITVRSDFMLEAGKNDLSAPAVIPEDFRYGIPTDNPMTSQFPEDLHRIYMLIMEAVTAHLETLGLEPDQPVLIKARAWDNDLAQLMQTVFGHQKTPGQLTKDFATIQGARTLPLQLFLRSLCAAAVMDWAFNPDPLGLDNDPVSREARTITAMRRVLRRRFDERVMRQLFFEATKDAIDEEIVPGVEARASVLAHRLFIAIAPFFQSPQLNHWSYVDNSFYLQPLYETHKDYVPGAGMANSSTGDSQTRTQTNVNDASLPGTTEFEYLLKIAFREALKIRYKWEKSHAASFTFDFPIFKCKYAKGWHFNEEYESSSTRVRIPSKYSNRVFVTTMFGVKARTRKDWTNEFSEVMLLSRPSVFNLD